MYKVVKYFTDLQDNNHPYHVGDIFPREGVEVTEDRLKELSTDKNKRGCPLIEKDSTKEIPKESPEEVKEEPQDNKTDVSPSKKSEAKRKPKKA